MLQHAFTMALFPEHQVKVAYSIPESTPEESDLLIVDAVALQSREAISAQQLRLLAAWKLPMIWIGGNQLIPAAIRDQVVGIEPPLMKEGLQRALVECLGKTAIPKRDGDAAARRGETPRGRQAKSDAQDSCCAERQRKTSSSSSMSSRKFPRAKTCKPNN